MQRIATHVGRTPADLGAIPNPRLYLGGGWIYCVGCGTHHRHEGYTAAPGEHYAVCTACGMVWDRVGKEG